jgi:hypothetical protein
VGAKGRLQGRGLAAADIFLDISVKRDALEARPKKKTNSIYQLIIVIARNGLPLSIVYPTPCNI